MTKTIELIFTEERRGIGTENDPVRMCRQLWTKDGRLVAEEDPTPIPALQMFLPDNLTNPNPTRE